MMWVETWLKLIHVPWNSEVLNIKLNSSFIVIIVHCVTYMYVVARLRYIYYSYPLS